MKLLCDHMFGSLAKWLRIFGYDTFYPTNVMTDDELLEIAQQEHRLILTRDKELLIRAKKLQLKTLEIPTTNLDEQLHIVYNALHSDTTHFLSRCTICNTLLTTVDKTTVKGNVPEKVYASKEQFWYCPTCQKYYWMGTHYEQMQQKIKNIIHEQPE